MTVTILKLTFFYPKVALPLRHKHRLCVVSSGQLIVIIHLFNDSPIMCSIQCAIHVRSFRKPSTFKEDFLARAIAQTSTAHPFPPLISVHEDYRIDTPKVKIKQFKCIARYVLTDL